MKDEQFDFQNSNQPFQFKALYGSFGTGNAGDIDHLMICFPKLTIAGFVSAAYVGGAISWYSDQICERVSLAAHELGHNFGLLHSSTYDDECKFFKGMCCKSLEHVGCMGLIIFILGTHAESFRRR